MSTMWGDAHGYEVGCAAQAVAAADSSHVEMKLIYVRALFVQRRGPGESAGPDCRSTSVPHRTCRALTEEVL